MIVNFLSDNACTTWINIINEQHDQRYNGNLDIWFQWIEQEWRCKVILNDDGIWIGMEFTEYDYLLTILKYGDRNDY